MNRHYAYVDFLCGQHSDSEMARAKRIQRGHEPVGPAVAVHFLRRLASEPRQWMERAACRGAPVSWFYEAAGGDPLRQYDKARALCDSCDVRQECATYGAKFGHGFGMWGGMTQRELRQHSKKVVPRCR